MSARMICPFNQSHVLTEDRFLTHIVNKCTNYQKVKHLYSQCQYDYMHFVRNQDVKVHQSNCPRKPPEKVKYQGICREEAKPRLAQEFKPAPKDTNQEKRYKKNKRRSKYGDPAALLYHHTVQYSQPQASTRKGFTGLPDSATSTYLTTEEKPSAQLRKTPFDQLFDWPALYMKELEKYRK